MSVMKVTALSVWLVRIPLCYLLGIYFGFGAIAIWWSMNASILVQAVFITRRYFSKKWIVPAERAI
jgi:Na+-driven multidrug efflux pump